MLMCKYKQPLVRNIRMKTKLVPQNPIILRCHRVMEGFAKSDDERDFYLDKLEGFLIYVDLDKSQEELDELFRELSENKDRYIPLPKMTFYEIKKVMECFVNEKIYDIDTKEKLLDIIQSREARENFLEFVYDHHSELEKWQQYYQERFRIRIIEWLRNNTFDFAFEEDIELTKSIVEKVKLNMFIPKVGKDIAQARKMLTVKAATYYSSEALNPRPKRGRPPKQVIKVETEPQFAQDIYTAVPKSMKPFLFTPDYHSSSMIFTFSGKFASEADLLAHRKQQLQSNLDLQTLSQKLAALKTLSSNWNRDDGEGTFGEALAADAGGEREPKSTPTRLKAKKESKMLAKEKLLPIALAEKDVSPKKSSPIAEVPAKKATLKKALPVKESSVKKSMSKKALSAKKLLPKKALLAKELPAKKSMPKKALSAKESRVKKSTPKKLVLKKPQSKKPSVKPVSKGSKKLVKKVLSVPRTVKPVKKAAKKIAVKPISGKRR